MIITEADITNLDKLTSLALRLWPENDKDDLRVEFEALIESNKDKVYLMVIEDVFVAFLHISLRNDYVEGSNSSPVGYVEGIFVSEEYRGNGISKRLVGAGEQWAKSMGCKQIASDVEIHNHGSQEFHKKVGFKEVGKIVAFIKDIDL
jgi:aminoglycoside 6'-N-acetyltransferase I